MPLNCSVNVTSKELWAKIWTSDNRIRKCSRWHRRTDVEIKTSVMMMIWGRWRWNFTLSFHHWQNSIRKSVNQLKYLITATMSPSCWHSYAFQTNLMRTEKTAKIYGEHLMLRKYFPKDNWKDFNYLMILHQKKPNCKLFRVAKINVVLRVSKW